MFGLIEMLMDWIMLMTALIGATIATMILVFLIGRAVSGKADFHKKTCDCNCSQQAAEVNP